MYVLECCIEVVMLICIIGVEKVLEFYLSLNYIYIVFINDIFLNLLCLLEEFSVDMIEFFLYYYFIIRIDVGLMRYCLCNMSMLKVLKILYFLFCGFFWFVLFL